MGKKRRALEKDVLEYMQKYDLDHSATGFAFLIDAVKLLINRNDLLQKRRIIPVYNLVAEKHDCKFSRVERAIRILLKKAECGMKNSEFIFEAADDIRLQRMGKLEEPP